MYGYVKDVLAEKGRQVFAIAPDTTVREAVRQMNASGVGAVLVQKGETSVGIFTERDVLRRVVDEGRDPDSTRVAEVMTRDLITVTPDTRVQEAMETMTAKRCRHLPVVEEDRVAGMISIGDLLRRVSMAQQAEIEHMTDYITGRRPA